MKKQVFYFYEALGFDGAEQLKVFNLYFPSGYDFFEMDEETKEDFISENPAVNRALLHALFAGEKMRQYKRPILLSAKHSESFGRFAQEEMGQLRQEELRVALLNTQLEIIGFETIFVGTLTEVSCSPREIFQRAFLANAYAIIIAHNHPSGTVYPSEQDAFFTKKLLKVGQDLNLPLLDSFIVTKDNYWSMAEEDKEL
ncbi:JAB domain-containing protein [Fructobacillus sp. M2-14]|uniref:JAB domain-containing protein n=1 Tax=Fructobacillus broussonetiae TaxID=2713173 RepID=A0ABS5R1J2_9LACO|nr:JAB domain-containing protein [Fructobacillus broussonetiae]MBS9338897.1 JAB domain-containing protein [Fructobacillus broussonetiae]